MEIKVVLDKEEVLKLCEKDKDFQVCIQKAALNYLRNNRLKPLMKEEIVREIEEYKRTLQPKVKKALEELGIKDSSFWRSTSLSLSDNIKEKMKEQIRKEMSDFINETVKAELNEAYQKTKTAVADWEKAIKYRIDTELTPARLKGIAKGILEDKIAILK